MCQGIIKTSRNISEHPDMEVRALNGQRVEVLLETIKPIAGWGTTVQVKLPKAGKPVQINTHFFKTIDPEGRKALGMAT